MGPYKDLVATISPRDSDLTSTITDISQYIKSSINENGKWKCCVFEIGVRIDYIQSGRLLMPVVGGPKGSLKRIK